MKLPFTKPKTSTDVERDRLAIIDQVDQITGRIVDAERNLSVDALDADLAVITVAQSELSALRLKRQALNAKADQLAAKRDEFAEREDEAAKVAKAEAGRRAHADAIKRMPAAVAKVEAAAAALNEALVELGKVDPYAGAMASIKARPAYQLPEGFSCPAGGWDVVIAEATRVRKAIMEGTRLNYSVRDDDCGRNVAASKIWGYV